MAVHGTISEANLRRSIKKHFIDYLYDTDSIDVYFDRIFQSPTNNVTQWVCVRSKFSGLASVCEADLTPYLFTKQDKEGDLLAELRDKVLNYLQGSIDLYDSNWNVVGYMKVLYKDESEVSYLPDNGKMKFMVFTLKWGAVY